MEHAPDLFKPRLSWPRFLRWRPYAVLAVTEADGSRARQQVLRPPRLAISFLKLRDDLLPTFWPLPLRNRKFRDGFGSCTEFL